MRRSKTEIYLHFVWAVRLRDPLLTVGIENLAVRTITAEAAKMGCQVIALNGTEDHLHTLVRVPGKVSAAGFAKQVKGVSSNAINDVLSHGSSLRWQEGYGCFSVSRSHVRRVQRYIEDQKERHSTGELWPEWEDTDTEVEPMETAA
jgi:putative transposase